MAQSEAGQEARNLIEASVPLINQLNFEQVAETLDAPRNKEPQSRPSRRVQTANFVRLSVCLFLAALQSINCAHLLCFWQRATTGERLSKLRQAIESLTCCSSGRLVWLDFSFLTFTSPQKKRKLLVHLHFLMCVSGQNNPSQ